MYHYHGLVGICGIDEAGRGPIAGPVTAAAVVLPEQSSQRLLAVLADSKLLTPKKRSQAAELIKNQAEAWSLGWGWPEEIDRLNIHRATLLAMSRALKGIYPIPELLLIDGLFLPDCPVPARAIVRGDQKNHAIMAASILAKTERDLWMIAYSELESRYGFEIHKGYPTRMHRMQVKRYGLSPIHRRSFKMSFPE